MNQLIFDFDSPLSEEKEKAVPVASAHTGELDELTRAARMAAVLASFSPLPPKATPAEYMSEKHWLRRYLWATEAYFYGRWTYWLNALSARQVPSEPIPQISFQSQQPVYSCGCWSANPDQHPGLAMLLRSMDVPGSAGLTWPDKLQRLIDWFLTSVGSYRGEGLVKVDSPEADWYYRTFQIHLLYEYPADYMSCFSGAIAGGPGNALGHYPTPNHLAECMVRMMMGDEKLAKTSSVLDPAAGTGILLLWASNWSLNLHAIDISAAMCKLLEFNAWIYVPWLVFPADFHPDGTLTPRADLAIQNKSFFDVA